MRSSEDQPKVNSSSDVHVWHALWHALGDITGKIGPISSSRHSRSTKTKEAVIATTGFRESKLHLIHPLALPAVVNNELGNKVMALIKEEIIIYGFAYARKVGSESVILPHPLRCFSRACESC